MPTLRTAASHGKNKARCLALALMIIGSLRLEVIGQKCYLVLLAGSVEVAGCFSR